MGAQIAPLAGKLGIFKKGSTVYKLTKWSFKITLNTGEILHFDSETDGASNYWPSHVKNYASGEGSAEGKIDNATNLIPISTAGLYIGTDGTFGCMWSTDNGITFPGTITGVSGDQDAAGQDGGGIGVDFKFTGPPTRVTPS